MSSQQKLEHSVSMVMLFGIGVSVVLLGVSLVEMALGMGAGAALAVWGMLFLISTPIVRVVMCLRHFSIERDWKYVALTLWVLAAMLAGAIIGAT
jgi:uncharacterized membrane protein